MIKMWQFRVWCLFMKDLVGSSGMSGVKDTRSLGLDINRQSTTIVRKYLGLPLINNALASFSARWVLRYPSYLKLIFLNQGRKWLRITNNQCGAVQGPTNHLNLAMQFILSGRLEKKSASPLPFPNSERIANPGISPATGNPGIRLVLLNRIMKQTDHKISLDSAKIFSPGVYANSLSLPYSMFQISPLYKFVSRLPANMGPASRRGVMEHVSSDRSLNNRSSSDRLSGALRSPAEPHTTVAASVASMGSGTPSFPVLLGNKRNGSMDLASHDRFGAASTVQLSGFSVSPMLDNLHIPSGTNPLVLVKESPTVRVLPSAMSGIAEDFPANGRVPGHRRVYPKDGSAGRVHPNGSIGQRKIAGNRIRGIKQIMPRLIDRYAFAPSSMSISDYIVTRILPPRIRSIVIPTADEIAVPGQKYFAAGNKPLLFAAMHRESSGVPKAPKSPAPSVIEHAYPTKARVQKEIAEETRIPENAASKMPPVLDIGKIADQIFSIMEKKAKIERERRGLYG